MSLINEALKKAQRQRLAEGADPLATSPAAANTGGGGHVVHRGKGQGNNTIVLIGSGALVLVVLSVVFTVYLVNRPSDTKQVAAAAPSAPAPVKSTAAASPPSSAPAETPSAIVVPKITLSNPPVTAPVPAPDAPSVAGSATPNTQSATTTPPPAATATPSTNTASAVTTPATQPAALVSPPAATPSVAPAPSPAAALPAGAPDERVAAFVDSVRVTGIRSSGAESRVLMNERVYRVNDIVERNLGVRLVKAAADSLTFSDPRGVTYVKNF